MVWLYLVAPIHHLYLYINETNDFIGFIEHAMLLRVITDKQVLLK